MHGGTHRVRRPEDLVFLLSSRATSASARARLSGRSTRPKADRSWRSNPASPKSPDLRPKAPMRDGRGRRSGVGHKKR